MRQHVPAFCHRPSLQTPWPLIPFACVKQVHKQYYVSTSVHSTRFADTHLTSSQLLTWIYNAQALAKIKAKHADTNFTLTLPEYEEILDALVGSHFQNVPAHYSHTDHDELGKLLVGVSNFGWTQPHCRVRQSRPFRATCRHPATGYACKNPAYCCIICGVAM